MGNIFQADQIHIQPQFFSHYHQMGKHNAEIQLFKFPQMVHIVLFCKHMDPVIVYHKPPWLAVHAGSVPAWPPPEAVSSTVLALLYKHRDLSDPFF